MWNRWLGSHRKVGTVLNLIMIGIYVSIFSGP